ncbi:hypothetical protein [Psychrobacter fulvigenes]|uniref:hypothetical protein n=1 Tax=Psychrobacter fulvigenes TaxID=533323 RepID=UPI001918528B|nr:hypothetical protein [Psychrobacter fulvigenes]
MQANHILSIFALASLVTLTGCSDKTPIEETTDVATPEVATSTETVVAESDATTESVAEVEVVEVIDENPPKFAQVTDYLALEPESSWNWEKLASISAVKEWDPKTPTKDEYSPEKNQYYIWGGLDDVGGMRVIGTKAQPEIITIGSGQSVMEDETGSKVYKVEDLFRASELTRVKSNCDKGENELFSQQFYKWEKPGHQPLYIYSIIDQANAGTSSDVGIAKSLATFFESDYSDALYDLRASDADYNDVTCTFDL